MGLKDERYAEVDRIPWDFVGLASLVCDRFRRWTNVDEVEFRQAIMDSACLKNKNPARLPECARAMNMEPRVWDAIGVML